MTDEITFMTIDPLTSQVVNDVKLAKAQILACPHMILLPEHYREDGSCRCNDPNHTEMVEWEYEWDNALGVWV